MFALFYYYFTPSFSSLALDNVLWEMCVCVFLGLGDCLSISSPSTRFSFERREKEPLETGHCHSQNTQENQCFLSLTIFYSNKTRIWWPLLKHVRSLPCCPIFPRHRRFSSAKNKNRSTVKKGLYFLAMSGMVK